MSNEQSSVPNVHKLDSKGDAPQNYKGKVIVLNPEQSEIAKNLKIAEKGTYALRTR